MKSIKEKAEAYDKVLEWATEAHKVCDGMLKEDLEHLFPELKESEDERIRKALIELVHDTTGDSLWVDYNVHKEDALAWLEKQGEQILANSAKTCKDEQNPAWSEEDERILNAAILHIKNETYNYYGGYSSEYIMRWLKSIKDRYTWKPSDEQMQQLSTASTGKGWFDTKPLRELYEQLKKLKG